MIGKLSGVILKEGSFTRNDGSTVKTITLMVDGYQKQFNNECIKEVKVGEKCMITANVDWGYSPKKQSSFVIATCIDIEYK